MTFMMADNMSVQEQASLWIVHLTSGDASDQDRREFAEWLAEDRTHAQAYKRAERLWDGLENTPELLDLITLPVISPAAEAQSTNIPFRPNRTLYKRLAGLAAAAVFLITASLLVMQALSPFSGATVHATDISEIRELSLPDGSRVTLGAKSTIRTDFTKQERRVTLTNGEAFFSVAKDATRPFIVLAGDTRVRVVGTKFDMRHGVGEVKVTVLEGVVKVDRLVPDTMPHVSSGADSEAKNDGKAHFQEYTETLTAGQEMVAAVSGPSVLREMQPGKIAPWRSGRLVYANESLREVVADANRYYKGEIRLATDDLGALRITASFRSEQIEQMIRSLMTAYELEVEHTNGKVIILRHRADPT